MTAGRSSEISGVTLGACPGCGGPLTGKQRACSARCRKRLERQRDADYVVTDEDRAAIRRVLDRDGCGHPRATPVTQEEVRAHVAAIAAARARGLDPETVDDTDTDEVDP